MQLLCQWKSKTFYIFWECVCSCRYPACSAHAPYCHLWPVEYISTLAHKLHNLRKTVIEYGIYVLILCTSFSWNISHSKKNWAKCDFNIPPFQIRFQFYVKAVTQVQHIHAYVFYTSLTKTVSIWDPTMQWNINNAWICLLGGPEDDLIRSKPVALTKYTIFVYK